MNFAKKKRTRSARQKWYKVEFKSKIEAVAKLAASAKTGCLWPVARGGVASPPRADGGLSRRAGEEERAQLDAKGRFCSPSSFAIAQLAKHLQEL